MIKLQRLMPKILHDVEALFAAEMRSILASDTPPVDTGALAASEVLVRPHAGAVGRRTVVRVAGKYTIRYATPVHQRGLGRGKEKKWLANALRRARSGVHGRVRAVINRAIG